MINRRRLLAAPLFLTAPLFVAGCGLSERPYAERRQWPLMPRRPRAERPRNTGPVLLVRTVRAGPGLESRGLQSLAPDGSIRSEFYEEWAVPPAQGTEEALRFWLADSGMFSAVLAPGSRLEADQVLEAELTSLWTIPATGQAHCALGITVVAERGTSHRVLLQQRMAAETPLAGTSAREAVEAQSAALAAVLAQIEVALRR